MKIENRKELYYPLLFMAIIFIESSIPMDGGSGNIQMLTDLDPSIQNILHIPLYAALAMLWLHYFKRCSFSSKKMFVSAMVISILYGCMDEVHQTFVPGRYGGLLDIYLDILGALLGSLAFFVVLKKPEIG